MNILFQGGHGASSIPECAGDYGSRSHACTKEHVVNDWKRGDFDAGSWCATDATIRFVKMGGGHTGPVTEDHSISTSDTCTRQFHMRIWDDVEHGHSNAGPHQWDIGPIHHENRPVCCSKHKIDMSWEAVENIARIQMGASQEGEPAHCTYPNYHRLRGSGPKYIQGWYSNGRITRISFHHIHDDPQGCHNQ